MVCSHTDTGQPYAIDFWLTERPAGEPQFEFCDTLEELRIRAERVIRAGRFKFAALYKRGNGPYGWEEIDCLSADDLNSYR